MIFNDTNITGYDVSFYQDDNNTPQGINFATMKNSGADFVIVRAGQNLWVDPDFETNWTNAKKAGLPRSSYWYFDPRINPVVQAKLFKRLFANDPPEGRLWIDLEFPASWGGSYGNPASWMAFIEELKFNGHRVGIYTGYYWWLEHTTAADRAYYAQYPLWLAWYTSNPSIVQIPAPWTQCLIWQDGTPAIGLSVGVESLEIDHNKFNGGATEFEKEFGAQVTPPPIDLPIGGTMPEYIMERNYESDCHVLVIDPSLYDIHVTDTKGYLEVVSSVAKRYGAFITTNADGWSETASYPHYPYSLAISDGRKYAEQFNFRPFLNIDKLGRATIQHNGFANLYNTASGFRYVTELMTIPVALFGNEIQYTEVHPRTGCGVTADGKIVLVIVDGRSATNRGVTLAELGSIMIKFGSITALDFDGGGSSTIYYSGKVLNIPSDGQERGVVNHLVFVKKLGGTTMNGTATTLVSKVKLWSAKQGTETGGYLAANTQFEIVEVSGTWVKLPNGNWANCGSSFQYAKVLTLPSAGTPVDPPPVAGKTLTNLIEVFNDGSVNVIRQ